MSKRRSAALSATFLILAACGGGGEQAASDPAPTTSSSQTGQGAAGVVVESIAFKPAKLTVLRGTEVTWTNNDAGVVHTVTSGQPQERAVPGVQEGKPAQVDGVFDGELADGGTFSFSPTKAGTFAYFCEVHPSMTATIVVR